MPPDDLRAAVQSARVILSRVYGAAIAATIVGSLVGLAWVTDPYHGDAAAYVQGGLWFLFGTVGGRLTQRSWTHADQIRELQDQAQADRDLLNIHLRYLHNLLEKAECQLHRAGPYWGDEGAPVWGTAAGPGGTDRPTSERERP